MFALLWTAGCLPQQADHDAGTNSKGSSTGSATDSAEASSDATDGGRRLDGGASDRGTTNAGETDAGETNAGDTDAGKTDAGKTDAASTDSDIDGGKPAPPNGGKPAPPNGGKPAPPNGAANLKPPAKFPEIKLSEQHKKTLVLNQGDTMPDFELPGLDGQPQKLSTLLGDRFTVVFFWPGESRIALREAPQHLTDLQIDIAEAYADHGVKVIGISHKQTPEDAKNIVDAAEISFPVLLDESGDAFAQVATEILPRTYLLDRERRILWFDLLYSFDTMRNLKQAIAFVLADDAAEVPAQ
jgi:peroxiredoxin